MKKTLASLQALHVYANLKTTLLCLSVLILSAVHNGAIAQTPSHTIYAVSDGNLVSFNSLSPAVLLSSAPITGLIPGQSIEGLDFRPSTGELYMFSYDPATGNGQLYTLNRTTAAATQVGGTLALATGMQRLSFDFNPVSDRIRVTSSTGHNYRLNPTTASITSADTPLSYNVGDPNNGSSSGVVTVGYTNNYPGAVSTALYFYDAGLNILGIMNPPNNGILNTVGSSGLSPLTSAGLEMDIVTNQSTTVNTIFLTANVSSSIYNLYTVNLSTGAAVLAGSIGGGIAIREMAVMTAIPAPAPSHTVYAVSGANLISFNSSNPSVILSSSLLTGITSGQTIEGLDFRPATGDLYLLGYDATTGTAQLYTVNTALATATAVGSSITLATGMQRLSFDFNPTVDRIRVTSISGQSYRLNPSTGALVATDGSLSYAAGDVHFGATPQVVTAAYTNNYAGSLTTTLYFYDLAFQNIGIINPPNNGTLNTVGGTFLPQISSEGLDIDIVTDGSSFVNTAFLTANVSGSAYNFYMLDLTTGSPTLVGIIGTGLTIREMAVKSNIPPPATSVPDHIIYAVSDNNLVSFNSTNPSVILSSVAISGIIPGQSVEGLDFRPSTGQLYMMTYDPATGNGQLYTLNRTTALATQVGGTLSLAAGMQRLSFDFNPVADRIRVTSSTGHNYRLNPTSGTIVATDTPLSYNPGDLNNGATPQVVSVAYINNYAGSGTTTLYFYDLGLNILGFINPPNNGILNTVGNSGFSPLTGVGLDMDIVTNQATATNTAFLTANASGSIYSLYITDLVTGAVSIVGPIGAGIPIREMAVMASVPAPPPNHIIYAASDNNLVSFNSTNPSVILSSTPITGLGAGLSIEGLDFRPLTGELYMLGYDPATGNAQVYTLNTATAAATAVGASIVLATGMQRLSFDFNPVVDRIRVASSTGNNYRLNPATGAIVSTDLSLSYDAGDIHAGSTPQVVTMAYINNYAGAVTTTNYFYDLAFNNLGINNPPNNGNLITIGATNLPSATGAGLDMDIVTDGTSFVSTAFLSANVSGSAYSLYTIDLTSGTPTLVGTIGASVPIQEMAVSLSASVIPVTLSEFNVHKSGHTAVLSWTTQTELNNDYFVIERSIDGAYFTTISDRISSRAFGGNSNIPLHYRWVDHAPKAGSNYYRLVQADRDGRLKNSNIKRADFTAISEIKVYPNPASAFLYASGSSAIPSSIQLRIIGEDGKLLRQTAAKMHSGNWSVNISLQGLPAGLYYMQLFSAGVNIHSESFIKK